MKVAVVGASGKTGRSIVNGLLSSQATKFDVTALTRPSSLQKTENIKLQSRGVKVIAANLNGPEDELVRLLSGTEVVISAIEATSFSAQIPLANAAKSAGVKRFVPCCFSTIVPPKGVHQLRDMKEDVVNHIKKIHLPYTVIDVGWWFQAALPGLPSGRTDYAAILPGNRIAGDGNAPLALTDIRDIGRYVARIISDRRTLNEMVFAYSEVMSQNQVFELLERLSAEKTVRNYISADALQVAIAQAQGSSDYSITIQMWALQYLYSMGIRRDNTSEYAKYLGYLDAKELYPDMTGNSLEAFFQEVLDGKVEPLL